MIADEIAWVRRYLENTKIYLEFGCGGSTRLAAEAGVAKLFSVDTDRHESSCAGKPLRAFTSARYAGHTVCDMSPC
jgi:hypothetical protein